MEESMTFEKSIFTEYSWNDFKVASVNMYSSNDFTDFPLFGKYVDENGYSVEFQKKFIEKAVNEESKTYQECLDDYIQMLLEGCRYSHEFCDEQLKKVLKYLMSKGAVFPYDELFSSRYESYKKYNPEEDFSKEDWTIDDEIINYRTRGTLIDLFIDSIDPLSYADWNSIKATSDFYESDNPIEEDRLKYLKYNSKELLKRYPCDGDENE